MGTWSITPDTGLASIDQNGLLTYSEHTSDITYTISYSDDEGCSTSKNVTIKKCTPPPADCPASGGTIGSWDGVVYRSNNYITGEEETQGHLIAFKTGDTTFTGTPTLSCDGSIITGVEWGSIDCPPGYQWINVTHVGNPGVERTGATVTISAPTANGTCVYNVPFTQKESTPLQVNLQIRFSGDTSPTTSPIINFIDGCDYHTATSLLSLQKYSTDIDIPNVPMIGGICYAVASYDNYGCMTNITVTLDPTDDTETSGTVIINHAPLNPTTEAGIPQILSVHSRSCGTDSFNTEDYNGHTLRIVFTRGHCP